MVAAAREYPGTVKAQNAAYEAEICAVLQVRQGAATRRIPFKAQSLQQGAAFGGTAPKLSALP